TTPTRAILTLSLHDALPIYTREAVGVRVLGDVLDGRLLRQRDGDGVAVVLADEHHRKAVDACEVERLVEVALRRGAVAEVADGEIGRASCREGVERAVGGIRDATVTGVQTCALPIYTREAVGVRVLGDVLDGRLLRQRDGDGVAVVLADEHHRKAVDACEVERLVEVALRRGAVAEVADG